MKTYTFTEETVLALRHIAMSPGAPIADYIKARKALQHEMDNQKPIIDLEELSRLIRCCFPYPAVNCDGVILVRIGAYNNLADFINKALGEDYE